MGRNDGAHAEVLGRIVGRKLGVFASQTQKKILKVFWAAHGSRTHAGKVFQSAFLIRVLLVRAAVFSLPENLP